MKLADELNVVVYIYTTQFTYFQTGPPGALCFLYGLLSVSYIYRGLALHFLCVFDPWLFLPCRLLYEKGLP